MPINSRSKGARGERMFRDVLRLEGYTAKRGQQHSGSPDSPDVICDELSSLVHFEVKFVEKLHIRSAVEQATRDAGDKLPIVAHKTSNAPWLITMQWSAFVQLLKSHVEAQQP